MTKTKTNTYPMSDKGTRRSRLIDSIVRPTKRFVRMLMLILSGIAAGAAITFPTDVGACLQWLIYIPAALVMISMSEEDGTAARGRLWRIYRYGFLFFMSEYLVVYHWFFSFYPLDFTGMSRPSAAVVVMVAWLGLSFLASVAGGGVFLLFAVLTRGSAVRRCPLLRPFLGGALFALFEWVETIGWMGVPWGRIALGQLSIDGAPTVRAASWFGSYFVAFAVVCVSFLLAEAILARHDSRRAILRASVALLVVAADILLGCAGALSGGSFCTSVNADADQDSDIADAFSVVVPNGGQNEAGGDHSKTIKVAAIQGNISSTDKFNISTDETAAIYLELVESAADSGAEIILTPESAINWSLPNDSKTLSRFCDIARENETCIVIGCLDGYGEGQENILIYIMPDGRVSDTVYSKRHLVPFGEYMPWRRLLSTLIPPLAEISILGYDLKAGESTAVAELCDGISIGGLICFDSIYEELAASSARDGANILLLGTNDSWFDDSAAVYMHNEQARLRAIETGLPIVRAANTGISSIIDKNGREQCRLEPLVDGIITAEVELGRASLYSRTGNIFIYTIIALCAGVATHDLIFYIADRYRRRKRPA